MVYFFLCSIWAIFTLCTHTYPSLESGEPLRLLSRSGYLWISAANAAFALAYLFDLRSTLRGPQLARRAHLTGLGLAAAVLVLVQVGAHLAHGPFPRS